jgi:predicted O-methyltransferase YrrM
VTRQPGLPEYDGLDLPPLVKDAVAATRESGFPLACTPETGHLLMTLAAHQPGGKIGELGTACGVGAAWIASGMQPGSKLVTVELDESRANIAASVFAERADVEVIHGDWSAVTPHAPFDMLFSDGGPKRQPEDPGLLAPLLRVGGLLLLDDYTPESAWTEEERVAYADDVSRSIWLENPDWSAIEIQLSARMSVILATRVNQ